MEARLKNISRALAESAIGAYNKRNVYNSAEVAVRVVYNELLIGAKCKTKEHKLAKNITRVALIAYWSTNRVFLDERKTNMEYDSSFHRAAMAVEATLKRMIRETNYQRRIAKKDKFPHLVYSH